MRKILLLAVAASLLAISSCGKCGCNKRVTEFDLDANTSTRIPDEYLDVCGEERHPGVTIDTVIKGGRSVLVETRIAC